MSTSWDVHCADCDKKLGLENGWADGCVALCNAASLLAEIAPYAQAADLELRRFSDHVGFEFFLTHKGHRLVAQSEYGERLDDCGVRYACGTCGIMRVCRGKKGHDGEHAEERREG